MKKNTKKSQKDLPQKSKGISLPIEMIVIIAIAVLVMVVLAAFFLGGFKTAGITDSAALGDGCNQWKGPYNCVADGESSITIKGYDGNGDKLDDTLAEVCARLGYDGLQGRRTCRLQCGCP